MKLWQTPKKLSKSHINILIVIPEGSMKDGCAHQHHIWEHLLFETESSEGLSLRSFFDKKGLNSNGRTTRDSIAITISAPPSSEGVNALVEALKIMLDFRLKSDAYSSIEKLVEGEIFSISTDFSKASRLTAEHAYWNELQSLDATLIGMSIDKLKDRPNNCFMELLRSALLVIDDPTDELYNALTKHFQVSPFIEESSNFEIKDWDAPHKGQHVPCRPPNLTSLVYGFVRTLSSVEQIAALAGSLCLTRGMRCGLLWDRLHKLQVEPYHALAWVQATRYDALFAVDWISQPNLVPLIKGEIIATIHDLAFDKDLIREQFPLSMQVLSDQFEKSKDLPVTMRLQAIAQALLLGKTDVSLESVQNRIEEVTPDLIVSIMQEMIHNRILLLNAGSISSIIE